MHKSLGPYSRTIYIVGFWLVEMVISTNQKPMIYRNFYENMDPDNPRTERNNVLRPII